MNRLVFALCLVLISSYACKQEPQDIKAAFEMFKETLELHQNILTTSADLKNQAKILDSKIRNEDKENVFAISEAYNHLDQVDASLQKLPTMEAVPGHSKEYPNAILRNAKLEPAQVLMIQKDRRDAMLLIKSDLDAAGTIIAALKAKFK